MTADRVTAFVCRGCLRFKTLPGDRRGDPLCRDCQINEAANAVANERLAALRAMEAGRE